MEKYNETTGKTQSVVDINLDATDLAPGQLPFETLIIYQPGSRKFITQNDVY